MIWYRQQLAGALHVLDLSPSADLLLSKFGWGHAFPALNQGLIDVYKQCEDAEEVVEAGRRIVEEDQSERARLKEAKRDATNIMLANVNHEQTESGEEDDEDDGQQQTSEELAEEMNKVTRIVD